MDDHCEEMLARPDVHREGSEGALVVSDLLAVDEDRGGVIDARELQRS
jgi:hypothetical protein